MSIASRVIIGKTPVRLSERGFLLRADAVKRGQLNLLRQSRLHIGIEMKLTRESWTILTIGTLDLATTLLWVNNHGAEEANPIFQYYLAMGSGWFILAKFVCLLCPILLFEFARQHRPQFALNGARIAIAGYLVMYAVGVAKLNPELLPGQRRQGSAILGTLGPHWTSTRLSVAEHTFRMPMNVTDSYPLEGIR